MQRADDPGRAGSSSNSHLEGRIDRLRFLTSDVAVLTAYGHIVYDDNRSSDKNKRTIYTVARRAAVQG